MGLCEDVICLPISISLISLDDNLTHGQHSDLRRLWVCCTAEIVCALPTRLPAAACPFRDLQSVESRAGPTLGEGYTIEILHSDASFGDCLFNHPHDPFSVMASGITGQESFSRWCNVGMANIREYVDDRRSRGRCSWGMRDDPGAKFVGRSFNTKTYERAGFCQWVYTSLSYMSRVGARPFCCLLMALYGCG